LSTVILINISPTTREKMMDSPKYIIYEFQQFVLMIRETILKLPKVKNCLREVVEQMDYIGIGSLGIILSTGFFMGLVLALQASVEMSHIGAILMVGRPVATSVVLELGPVFVAIMVAARSGSAMAAELASMVITEQIDALKVEGGDPILDLVVPRFVACSIVIPFLTIIGSVAALLGGHVIAIFYLKISPYYYWNSVFDVLTPAFLWGGLIKSFVFAIAIALIGCFSGLSTRMGAKGLGAATTRAVVLSSISILGLDFLMTRILIGRWW